MLNEILRWILYISIGMIIVGICEIFTVTWGEKWYPGLAWAFWKLPNRIIHKLILYGFVLMIVSMILIAIVPE